ncbi:hypothetical protein BGZ65_009603 [Modicella reniformis]|uniref:Uncharacterized protein n=1 Tax=Modicella reniformis TaxID=1440133 RepID=A0A9P6JG07_9FUNG|nr:hypothetical protein BGZ65_009603 [Modicella reniformis]
MRKLWHKANEIVPAAGYERYKSDRHLQETVQNICLFNRILCLSLSASSHPTMVSGGMSMNVYDPIEEISLDKNEDHLLDRPVLEIAVSRSRDECDHKKSRMISQVYEEATQEFEIKLILFCK